MEALKDCPFCGSVPKIDNYKSFGRTYYTVLCTNDEECFMTVLSDGSSDRENAIDWWNNRPEQTQ